MGFDRDRYNPLSDPLFGDLRWYAGMYKVLHTAAFFAAAPTAQFPDARPIFYPPLTSVALAPIYAAASPEGVFVAISVAWFGMMVWWVRRELVRQGIAAATATLFPVTLGLMLFPAVRLVHEGNVELLLWICAAVGTWAFLEEKDDWAAVLWGLAAAMKLYPAVLLILFLPRKKYRAIGMGVATIVVSSLASVAWLGPTIGIAWRGSLHNVFEYQGIRVSEWSQRELMANHSVFGLVKLVALIAGWHPEKLTLPYYACGMVVMLGAFFWKLWRMPVANQLLAVSVFMVALSPISYFHTLVHLYVPVVVLMLVAIRAERVGATVRGLELTVMLCVPLFAATNLFTWPSLAIYNGLMQAVLLLLLFLCGVQYPFVVSDRAMVRT
jgi:hypothetical protein